MRFWFFVLTIATQPTPLKENLKISKNSTEVRHVVIQNSKDLTISMSLRVLFFFDLQPSVLASSMLVLNENLMTVFREKDLNQLKFGQINFEGQPLVYFMSLTEQTETRSNRKAGPGPPFYLLSGALHSVQKRCHKKCALIQKTKPSIF